MNKPFMSAVWPTRKAFQSLVQEEALLALPEETIAAPLTEALPFFQDKNIARKPSLPKAWRQL
jgi:hypothetical protein